MKRIIAGILLIVAVAALAVGCGSGENRTERPLKLNELKSISQLRTLTCEYHNTMTREKENVKTFLWFKSDYTYWIEYDGSYDIVIDLEKMDMNVEEKEDGKADVSISLPEPMADNFTVVADSFGKYEIIGAKDEIIGEKYKPKVDEYNDMRAEAQSAIMAKVTENKINYDVAKKRAETVLTEYINLIGASNGTEYSVEFKWTDNRDNDQ